MIESRFNQRSVRRYAETLESGPSLRVRLIQHRHFPTALLISVLIGLICLHIWQRVFAIELANEVASLRSAQQSYTDVYKKQASIISALSTPTRIQAFASDSLGMLPVSADRLFTVVAKSSENSPISSPLSQMYAAFQRLGDYLPTSTEAMAEPRDLVGVTFDSAHVATSDSTKGSR